MKLVAVVLISTTPEWYRLDFDERCRLRADLARLMHDCQDVECRWFDSEPWAGNVAEIVVCEFSCLHAYWKLWNDLRETPVFRHPYAHVSQVSLGYERPLSIGLVET